LVFLQFAVEQVRLGDDFVALLTEISCLANSVSLRSTATVSSTPSTGQSLTTMDRSIMHSCGTGMSRGTLHAGVGMP